MISIAITNIRRVIFLLFLSLVVLIIGLFLLLWGTPVISRTGELVIPEGSSAQTIWQQLVQQDYVDNTVPLRYYGWRLEANNNIKSGTYTLSPGEHVRDLIKRLVAGDTNSSVLTVTFPEGFTLDQIAERMAAQGIGKADDFIAAAIPEKFIDQFSWLSQVPFSRNLEGYLFPDTYQFYADDTPVDVIQRMLANFDAKIKTALFNDNTQPNHPLDQVIIMASIIEREVISDEDMAIVSGVLWKRLNDGVGLDVDATVRYALQKWDKPLTYQDLQTESPYNTRRWPGLPPGPISNPGLRAIQAAVNPQESDYYYYLSAPSGKTIFSRTLEEHNMNKAKYLN
ncbi:MAG: hypothetical protein A3E37_01940 [Candidatus Andersenbacteria bacterium RIFCSPHIGHO2_12_FULL_46_9]|nr:MAG: Aminodeoxychorismate lyase [Parcubacteria group bacterium GW2011_GWA2_45_14]OGY33177.1 MAG: hypothetical protein A3B76_04845 [Candidatus Andersenbacteria bacterium RIFCSPHIGHO2_02_FULL_46_16]OGY38480.1 MAG: hypothetical protein A3G57_04040 [Candidatus Andersenbacteria bacterium RIFCSPLOWO2_12_FULL_45_8]OGY38541.1 MAG: hypothetical protein A3E37_01940 [Candidatus Andersenbacteria bacterium RIFCSPHIGHO2_12_FULL_46_9]HBE90342.1 endolytic transglycosylase MltG [Candidatus Andersenbacteria b